MKTIIATTLIFLASGSGTAAAFTATPPTTTISALSSSRYNDDYYRDYSNNASYNAQNYNNRNNNINNNNNYVTDRNSGRFDNSVGSASYATTSYGSGYAAGRNRRNNNNNNVGGGYDSRGGYGSSSQYRTYDNYNSADMYRGAAGGGSVVAGGDYYNRPYDRIGSSENFRLTSSPNSRRMRGTPSYSDYGIMDRGGGGGGLYDYDYRDDNYVVQNRRGGYADDNIGGRSSRYSTPMYSNGGYASPQGLSEDFRTGREGPITSSMSSSQRRRTRNINQGNRIQDYYTPGERELMSQRQNSGLRYGWQQQYNRDRGNVRMGSGEDFRRGSSLSRISDYFTPLERERRQMSDNRALGRGGGREESYNNYYGNIENRRGGRGLDGRRGGYYDDYPDYGFESYDDGEDDDYFENDGGYSSGSRRRARNGSTWDNLLNMFK